ncbi:MAG: AsnC family transcriptional regulator [Thermoprotei archaeon]|nr:MAG: AsnC family transcriptional regulator [Thermoprotei archaeon]
MPRKVTELDKKIYEYLLDKGGKGVPQNILWKELNITSRDASRSLKKLEELGLVKREPIVYNGRRTFKVIAIRKSLEALKEPLRERRPQRTHILLDSFTEIPCMSCPYIDMCYEGGYYDPTNCDLVLSWVKRSVKASHTHLSRESHIARLS